MKIIVIKALPTFRVILKEEVLKGVSWTEKMFLWRGIKREWFDIYLSICH